MATAVRSLQSEVRKPGVFGVSTRAPSGHEGAPMLIRGKRLISINVFMVPQHTEALHNGNAFISGLNLFTRLTSKLNENYDTKNGRVGWPQYSS